MNSKINLAKKKVDPQKLALQKRVGALRVIAFSFLLTVCLVSVILFVMIVASPLPALRSQEEELFLALNSLNTKFQRAVFVDKQLDNIDQILATRSDLPQTMEDLISSAPASVSVLAYTATNGIFEFTVSGNNLNDIETFLTGVTALSEGDKGYKNIYVSEILLNTSSGAYQVRISMAR